MTSKTQGRDRIALAALTPCESGLWHQVAVAKPLPGIPSGPADPTHVFPFMGIFSRRSTSCPPDRSKCGPCRRILWSIVFMVFLGPLLSSKLLAQDPQEEVGFFRIINAVAAGQGKAQFYLDGENLYPAGYNMGQKTGGIGIKAGNHVVSIRKNGVLEGSTKVSIANGETVSLVGFSELVPPKKDGDKPTWQIRILRLKQSDPERGYQISFISVCDKEEIEVKVGNYGRNRTETTYVKRLHVAKHNLGRNRGETIIKVGENVLTTVSPDIAGNYVVLLYQDESSAVKALSFFDPKFVIAE